MNEAKAKDALIDAQLEIIKLRARVGEMEARYDNVTISLEEKCAELAAIKPDWSDAPKSAVWRAYDNDGSLLFWTAAANPEAVDDDYGWSSLGIIDTENWRFPNWCDTLERRPEET